MGQKAEVQESAISTQIKPFRTRSHEKLMSAAAKAREDNEQRERRQKTEQDELAQPAPMLSIQLGVCASGCASYCGM